MERRDPISGTFTKGEGMHHRLLENAVGPRDTGADLVWAALRRTAPRSAALIESLMRSVPKQGTGVS